MEQGFIRKPSGLESFFIDLDDCGCNMTIHYFLKVSRQPSLPLLNQAMQKSLETHNGMNLRYYKKAWYSSEELPECQVADVECEDIHTYNPVALDFRRNTLSLDLLHMITTDEWFMRFNFFHGAVDGRSCLQFIYDYFSILNGQLPGANSFSLLDYELVTTDHRRATADLGRVSLWPTCKPKDWQPISEGEDRTHVFKTDSCSRSLATKISRAVASCFTTQRAQMLIPVDVRRYAGEQNKNLFGNLIVPIFVDANTSRNSDDLRSEIISYVKDKRLLAPIAEFLNLYNLIPAKLRLSILRMLIPLVMASRKFICCALVSPIGEVQKDKLISPHFNAEDVSVTFVSFPFTAFTVTCLQFDGHTNTTVSWHSGRVPEETAQTLIESLDQCMYETVSA